MFYTVLFDSVCAIYNGRATSSSHDYCLTEHCSGSRSDGSGGTWSCSVEAHVGRRRASTDELAGRTRVATQQLHVPSVSSAVQLGCAGGFPGRISLEMPSVPASSQRAGGFFFQEQLAPGKVDVDAPLVGVGHPRAPRCLIRCEWKMDYKMMANTGNSDSTRVHSPLDVFV